MILIDSLFINNSGGKVLLDYLVSELESREIYPFYLFDQRCQNFYKEIPENRKIYLQASLRKRHLFYKKNSNKFSTFFCFGNIPPTIKLDKNVYTYFHHGGILSDFKNTVTIKAKNFFKRKIINYYSKNTTFFICQSDFIRKIFCKKLKIEESKCLVIPFFKEINPKNLTKKNGNKFLYVSGGNIYKNHENLLRAWEILSEKGIFPELHLTVTNNYTKICNYIEKLSDKGLKITNHGFTNVNSLYEDCKFLIFPSIIETFGLGLIEGAMYNCSVVASNKEYVYSVVNPSKTFDPIDPMSITDAVMEVLQNDYKETTIVIRNKINELIEIISYAPTHSEP